MRPPSLLTPSSPLSFFRRSQASLLFNEWLTSLNGHGEAHLVYANPLPQPSQYWHSGNRTGARRQRGWSLLHDSEHDISLGGDADESLPGVTADPVSGSRPRGWSVLMDSSPLPTRPKWV